MNTHFCRHMQFAELPVGRDHDFATASTGSALLLQFAVALAVLPGLFWTLSASPPMPVEAPQTEVGATTTRAVSGVTFSPLSSGMVHTPIDAYLDSLTQGFICILDEGLDDQVRYYWHVGSLKEGWLLPASESIGPTSDYRTAAFQSPVSPNNSTLIETALVQRHLYRWVRFADGNPTRNPVETVLQTSSLEMAPEPTTLTLFGLGSLALVVVRRRG